MAFPTQPLPLWLWLVCSQMHHIINSAQRWYEKWVSPKCIASRHETWNVSESILGFNAIIMSFELEREAEVNGGNIVAFGIEHHVTNGNRHRKNRNVISNCKFSNLRCNNTARWLRSIKVLWIVKTKTIESIVNCEITKDELVSPAHICHSCSPLKSKMIALQMID